MLNPNQIERLMEHTKRQLISLEENDLLNADPDAVWYRKGFIAALKIVLYCDKASINNKPINKEKPRATRSTMD